MGVCQTFWSSRKYHLDRMSLHELSIAYFQYPAIQAYIVLLALSAGIALYLGGSPAMLGFAAALTLLAYPLVWYVLHRCVLHGRFLYRSPSTSALWKRIHYDHHCDPNDLRVLFGALHTTLPTLIAVTLPLGGLVGGPAGAAAAFAAGLAVTLFYEYCHCIQHLHYTPRSRFLRRIKRLHLMHHYRNENGNYGITNFFWDRALGTYYDRPDAVAHSATVFNLGYADGERVRYPWVAQLSEDKL